MSVTENIESLLRCAILGQIMDEEAQKAWSLDGIDPSEHQSLAIRMVAQILTPPQQPSDEDVGVSLLMALWAAYPQPLGGILVEKTYRASVIKAMIGNELIGKTLSGYYLKQAGVDYLAHNVGGKKEDTPSSST